MENDYKALVGEGRMQGEKGEASVGDGRRFVKFLQVTEQMDVRSQASPSADYLQDRES